MKTYRHGFKGKQRILGYQTGDTDIYVAFAGINNIKELGEDVHVHSQSDEIYIPLRGKGTIWVNGKIYRLRPGHPIRVESGEPHRILSVFRAPLEYLVIKNNTANDKIELQTPEELEQLMIRHGIL